MAELHLVTGYKGSAHITSADQGVFNAGCLGTGEYVLSVGKKFEAQVITNNAVRIYDGALVINGRYVNLNSNSYLDAIISNGTSGMKRNDIIGVRYAMNTATGVESVSLIVLEGTSSTDTPTDPTSTYTGNIINGVTTHDMFLYRVVINGLNIERVEPLFQVLAPMIDFHHGFYKQNLLINGDFQCDQRGRGSYDTSKASAYTVDMWRGYQVKVSKLNEGIKLTGSSADTQGYFTQFIQLGKLKTTWYTISAMVDDKICTFTVTPGGAAKEKVFEKFKITTLTTSTWDNTLGDYNNKLKVNICPIGTNSFTIKYVDVFEGTVAYPHVKEDPATALMRCKRYIQAGTQISPWMWYRYDEKVSIYRCVLSYDQMAVKNPSLLSCTAYVYTNASEEVGIMSGAITKLTTYDAVNVNAMDLEINFNVTGTASVHERCFGFKLIYVLSCEPNDA